MAAAKGSEGDYMAVAYFCLKQAHQAIALVRDSSGEPDSWHGLDDFDRDEFYVLKLDHVYESCCILYRDKRWPSAFTRSARRAAQTFIRLWRGTNGDQRCEACSENEPYCGPIRKRQAKCEACKGGRRVCNSCRKPMCNAHARHRFGKDLRNVVSHHEEVLADRRHRHRGEPDTHTTIRGVDTPLWVRGHVWDSKNGPEGLWLTGKDYRLRGVHEALVKLEQEFSAVLMDPVTGKLREDS